MRRGVRNVGLTLLSVLGSFLLAEAVLRLFPVRTPRLRAVVSMVDDERVYVLRPKGSFDFLGVRERLPQPVTWQVNAQGLRSAVSVPPRPPRNRFRIATYGDSETFGWSVDLEDSFQALMERFNPGIEVLNFGVPGYNIDGVARHIEETAGVYSPDLLLYVVHPNDFEPPVRLFDSVLWQSELARRSVYLYYMFAYKRIHRTGRRTPERISSFVSGLRRIVRVAEQNDMELVLGFLDWDDRTVLQHDGILRRYFLGESTARALDLSPFYVDDLKVDDHLSQVAHRMLAQYLIDTLPKLTAVSDARAGAACAAESRSTHGTCAGRR